MDEWDGWTSNDDNGDLMRGVIPLLVIGGPKGKPICCKGTSRLMMMNNFSAERKKSTLDLDEGQATLKVTVCTLQDDSYCMLRNQSTYVLSAVEEQVEVTKF